MPNLLDYYCYPVCRHLNRDMPGEGDGLIFPDRGSPRRHMCHVPAEPVFDMIQKPFFPAMLLIIARFRDDQVTYFGRLSTDLGRQLMRKGEAASVVFR